MVFHCVHYCLHVSAEVVSELLIKKTAFHYVMEAIRCIEYVHWDTGHLFFILVLFFSKIVNLCK